MFNQEKKVRIELKREKEQFGHKEITNPIKEISKTDKLALMVKRILEEELPMLKDNSLLYDLVLYTLVEKMNTVQNVENVISCIKENKVKEVKDVAFRNGEVFIKCSV